MIVLDTNVVSELMRAEPEPSVVTWIDEQPADQLFVTSITVAELSYGVARLPDGKRRRELAEQLGATIDEDFRDRVLPFDDPAAREYAEIVVGREQAGRPISMADAQIAAICRSRAATIATRNVDDFARTGVSVLDPWRPPPSAP